jgi:hypothetical protein
VRYRFTLVLVTVGALGACDDDLSLGTWDATPDTIALFSLSRPDGLGFPSAYDFSTRRVIEVETPGATGNWDVVLADGSTALQLVPAGAFEGQTSRAAIATIPGQAFDDLTEAPADTARFTAQPVMLEAGGVYVVRSRRVACGFSTAVHYAKILAVTLDPVEGIATFAVVANPLCNDRSFIPPDE